MSMILMITITLQPMFSDDITREIFEECVPSARTSSDVLFSRLQGQFMAVGADIADNYVGSSLVSSIVPDSDLEACLQRMVCIETFRRNVRSFDIVPTATGFGVVNNQNVSPASQQRVDNLLAELSRGVAECIDRLLVLLPIFVSGWGDSVLAQRHIRTLYYRFSFLRALIPDLTAERWGSAQIYIQQAHSEMSLCISPEYMTYLLGLVRHGSVLQSADAIMVDKCRMVTSEFILRDSPGSHLDRSLTDLLVTQLESYPDSYPVYVASPLYKSRHNTHYANKQEDPSFFFGW